LPGAGGELPATLPAAFRAIIARCLSAAPGKRPTVAELRAWLEAGAPAAEPAPPPATRLRIRVELPDSAPAAQPAPAESRRPVLPWIVTALIIVGIAVGGGLYLRRASEPAATPAAAARAPAPTTPVAPVPPAPVAPPVAVEATPPAAPASPVHEVLPQVSRNALGTIRGTLRVAIRVTVDGQGAVTSAVTDVAGPSRYFEQRSLEAARGWTFGPGPERRSFRLRFAFTRGGVTAAATPVP
jgi:TonB family protein